MDNIQADLALQQEQALQAQELQLPSKGFEGPEPVPSPDHALLMTQEEWAVKLESSAQFKDLKKIVDILLFTSIVELFIIVGLVVEISQNGNVVKKPSQTSTSIRPAQASHTQAPATHAQQNVLRVPHNSGTNTPSTGGGVH